MRTDVALIVLVGYLIGSIPTAYLVARYVAGEDVRRVGEGNVGARNVFHVVGPSWGLVTFVVDAAKGALVAALFGGGPGWQVVLAGVAVLVGHMFPVWLRFVGGKGLSTVGGFAVVLMPWAAAAGSAAAALAWVSWRLFLPTTVVAIVTAIVVAPLTGVDRTVLSAVVLLFALTGLKRALDEGRMREVEASTGWDRIRGLRP
jgi:acyl phosphate:glycerol-3-phosphate acyltransferase